MKELIDVDKIENLEDLLAVAKFILKNTQIGVEKDKVIGYEEIQRLLRSDNNGTGN